MTNRRLVLGIAGAAGLAIAAAGGYAWLTRSVGDGGKAVSDESEIAAARRYCAEIPPEKAERTYECWVGWYPRAPRDQLRAAAAGRLAIGMTADLVRRVWGRPESINATDHAGVHREQWVYGGGRYAYLTNNGLTAFQDSR